MQTWAFWAAKGGLGKTTLAANVGAALAGRGRRVLLLDLDAQASLTRSLGMEPEAGLLDVLGGAKALAELVRETPFPGLDLVPADPTLVRAERSLGHEPGVERVLALALKRLDARRWTHALLDAPPGVGLLAVAALAAAQLHVAPVTPDPLGVAGLADALEVAAAVRERLNPALGGTRIVISRAPRTRAARLTSEGLRARFKGQVARAEVPERSVVVEAAGARAPVVIYAPEHPVADALRALARELARGGNG